MKLLLPKNTFPVIALLFSLLACSTFQSVTAPSTEPPVTAMDWVVQDERTVTLKNIIGNPSFSPDGQWFAIYAKDHHALCVFSTATLEIASCVPHEGYVNHGIAWSPDSQKLAFTEDAGLAQLEPDIWLYSLANRTLTNLTDDNIAGSVVGREAEITSHDNAPTWSPDGKWLAFARYNWVTTGAALYRVSVNGGTPEKLLEIAKEKALPIWPLHWAADKIFYHQDGIWEVSANGGEPRKIANQGGMFATLLADVSADGEWAQISYPDEQAFPSATDPVVCALLEIRSGEMKPLPSDPRPEGVSWAECGTFSPDDTKIAYLLLHRVKPMDFKSQYTLVVRDLIDDTENWLYATETPIGDFPLSRVTWTENNLLYLPGSAGLRFILLTLTTHSAQTTPLAIVAAPTATQQPTPVPTELPVASERLVRLKDMVIISLSPDGQRLFAYNFVENELCEVSTETLEVEACKAWTSKKFGTISATWSPDSRRVAFTEDAYLTATESDIWVLDANTGQLTNLTDDGVTDPNVEKDRPFYLDTLPTWSSDGQSLLFTRSVISPTQNTALYRIPVAGGEVQKVADLLGDQIMAINTPFHLTQGRLHFSILSRVKDYPYNGYWTINENGQNPLWLVQNVALIDVSPDGQWAILFEAGEKYPKGMWWLYNLKNNQFQPLQNIIQASTQPDTTNTYAVFSPDGSKILYTYHDQAARAYKLALSDLDGANHTELYTSDQPLVVPYNSLNNLQCAENNLVLFFRADYTAVLLQLTVGE